MRLRSLHRLRQAALRISPAVKAQRGSRPLSMPMRRNCLRLEPIEASRTRSREAFSAASVVTTPMVASTRRAIRTGADQGDAELLPIEALAGTWWQRCQARRCAWSRRCRRTRASCSAALGAAAGGRSGVRAGWSSRRGPWTTEGCDRGKLAAVASPQDVALHRTRPARQS